MDKYYMLDCIERRMKVLKERYQKACRCKNDEGNEITAGAAAAIRTQCKRDIQLLELLKYLLIKCSSVWIDDVDMSEGFHRLVEPVERYRRKRTK